MSLTVEVYDSGTEEDVEPEVNEPIASNIVEYYTSKEDADKAIAEFELSTSTKFIKLFRHKYNPYKSRIRWDPNSGVPFTISQSAKLECHHGKDRDFDRKERRKSLKNGTLGRGGKRKYLRIEGTIKRNCKACISILEIWTYPQFEIDEVTKPKQTEGSKQLRHLLATDALDLEKEYGCWVTFPSSAAHSGHVVGEPAEMTQPIDFRLVDKIHSLVEEGVFSVPDIKVHLRRFVNSVLFKDVKPPPVSNKRFHPSLKVIRHHYYKAFIDKKFDDVETPLNMKVLMTLDPGVVEKIANRKIVMSAKALRPDPRLQAGCIIARIRNNAMDLRSESELVKARDELTSILQEVQSVYAYEQSSGTEAGLFDMARADAGMAVTEEVTVLDPLYQQVAQALDATSFAAVGYGDEASSALSALPNSEQLQMHLQPHFTPSIKSVSRQNLEQLLLKNGPHYLSLVQLKCLERYLDSEERQLVLRCDDDFKEGWLIADVIDSYMWSLCQEYKNVAYASSADATRMQQNLDLGELWKDETLAGRQYIFIPWNPTGGHWLLLAVDVRKRTLLYLDPKKLAVDASDVLVTMAKAFVAKTVLNVFGLPIQGLETKERTLQHDRLGCGVMVCMYAKWLASNQPLLQTGSDYSYRREIFDCISGNLF